MNSKEELDELIKSLKICVTEVEEIQGPPKACKNNSGPPRGTIFIVNYQCRNQRRFRI